MSKFFLIPGFFQDCIKVVVYSIKFCTIKMLPLENDAQQIKGVFFLMFSIFEAVF